MNIEFFGDTLRVDGQITPYNTMSRNVADLGNAILKIEHYDDQNSVEIENLRRVPAAYAKHFPVLLDHGTFGTNGTWLLESKLNIDWDAVWKPADVERLVELLDMFHIHDVRADMWSSYAHNAGITRDGEVVIWDLGIASFPELELAEVAGA